jgi:hypothetical protein
MLLPGHFTILYRAYLESGLYYYLVREKVLSFLFSQKPIKICRASFSRV